MKKVGKIRKILCILLSVAICFVATGCNMSLYNEVLVSEDYVKGNPSTVQVESQVEKTVEDQIEVYVEGPASEAPSNSGNANIGDGAEADIPGDDDTNEVASNKFTQMYLKQIAENVASGIYKEKLHNLGFGFYGLGKDEFAEAMYSSGYVNTVISGDYEMLKKGYNVKSWVNIDSVLKSMGKWEETGSTAWQDNFDALNQRLIDQGLDDHLWGWYLDEPSSMPAVRELSRYAQKYGRRFLVVFAVQQVSPRSYGGYLSDRAHTTRHYTEFLTDVGFDCYWGVEANRKMFDNIIEDMHNTCPEDARIWYVPGCYGILKPEEHNPATYQRKVEGMNSNIYALYDYLLKEEHPGGLLMFTGSGYHPGEKFYGIRNLNEQANGGLSGIFDTFEIIGSELCRMK